MKHVKNKERQKKRQREREREKREKDAIMSGMYICDLRLKPRSSCNSRGARTNTTCAHIYLPTYSSSSL